MGDLVIQHVMLLGGPGDGRVVEVNTTMDVIVFPIEHEPLFDAVRIEYDTYNYQRCATPDRWVQVVYVHQDVDIYSVPESDMIRAIMTVWRAKHRKAAEAE